MDKGKTPVLIAGYPGDMASRIYSGVEKSPDYFVATVNYKDHPLGPVVLSGDEHKGERIDDDYKKQVWENERVNLVTPDKHFEAIRSFHQNLPNGIAINFADAKGYGVNTVFTDLDVPFISGVTGMRKEDVEALEHRVKESNICAILDQNMNPALVVLGAMFRFAGDNFPGALKGFSGYGMDSHQTGKKDGISGTLVKWMPYFSHLGVNFVPQLGDRTGVYGHADHMMRLSSADGTTRLGFETNVFGREPYVDGTLNHAAPFLVNAMKMGNKGKVYSMEDVLRKNYNKA